MGFNFGTYNAMNKSYYFAVVAFIRVAVVLVTMFITTSVKADNLFDMGENYLYQVVEVKKGIPYCLTWQPEEGKWSKTTEPVTDVKINNPFVGQVLRIAIHGETYKTVCVSFDQTQSKAMLKKLATVKKKPQVERYRAAFDIAAQVATR